MGNGIIGKKLGMTQVFASDGTVTSVTVIKAGPCVVVQRKTVASDGYEAVQLGLVEDKSPKRTNKPMQGHFAKAGIPPTKVLREVRLNGSTEPINVVCRYAGEEVRRFLPPRLVALFDDDRRRTVAESLCVLYVAMTRAAHCLHMIVAPPKANEKSLPKTYAGLLRGTLGSGLASAAGVVYQQGDARWFERLESLPPLDATQAEEPPAAIRLAPPLARPFGRRPLDATRRRREQPVAEPHEHALSGTVRPKDDRPRSSLGLERDPVDDRPSAGDERDLV